MKRILDLAAEHDLFVISDEIYEAFVFEGAHDPPSQFDSDGRVVTISGYSKTYAMTGWRLGYAVAALPVATAVGHVVESMVLSASAISQEAAEAVATLAPEVVAGMREAYRARARVVVDLLGGAGLLASVPKGAFYAQVDVSGTGRSSYRSPGTCSGWNASRPSPEPRSGGPEKGWSGSRSRPTRSR